MLDVLLEEVLVELLEDELEAVDVLDELLDEDSDDVLAFS